MRLPRSTRARVCECFTYLALGREVHNKVKEKGLYKGRENDREEYIYKYIYTHIKLQK